MFLLEWVQNSCRHGQLCVWSCGTLTSAAELNVRILNADRSGDGTLKQGDGKRARKSQPWKKGTNDKVDTERYNQTCTQAHTDAYNHTHARTHTHALLFLALALSLSRTSSLSLTQTYTQHTNSPMQTSTHMHFTQAHSRTHSRTLLHTHPQILMHEPTQSHTHSCTPTLSLALSLALCLFNHALPSTHACTHAWHSPPDILVHTTATRHSIHIY